MNITCHPERKHAARGLCRPCYWRWRYKNEPELRARIKAARAEYYTRKSTVVSARVRANYEKTQAKHAYFSRRLKVKWGWSIQDYLAMLESQGGVCAICQKPPEKERRLTVDHCHKSGKIRGLLHRLCNLIIGNAKDDPKLLDGAVNYLRRNGHE